MLSCDVLGGGEVGQFHEQLSCLAKWHVTTSAHHDKRQAPKYETWKPLWKASPRAISALGEVDVMVLSPISSRLIWVSYDHITYDSKCSPYFYSRRQRADKRNYP